MIVKFHANSVVTEHPDSECFFVGFADDPVETNNYLLLQRAFDDEVQDIALGHDTYHVELSDQSHSGYGGLSTFLLQRHQLELSFASDILDQLDGIVGAQITFQLSDQQFELLHEQLKLVFTGSNCFARVAT